MNLELLNYNTSFLSPMLKWIAPILFLLASVMLAKTYRNYGGVFKDAMGLLVTSVFVGALAFLFRVGGDFILPNFKWGESLFYLVFVVFNVIVAAKFLKLIKEFKSNV